MNPVPPYAPPPPPYVHISPQNSLTGFGSSQTQRSQPNSVFSQQGPYVVVGQQQTLTSLPMHQQIQLQQNLAPQFTSHLPQQQQQQPQPMMMVTSNQQAMPYFIVLPQQSGQTLQMQPQQVMKQPNPHTLTQSVSIPQAIPQANTGGYIPLQQLGGSSSGIVIGGGTPQQQTFVAQPHTSHQVISMSPSQFSSSQGTAPQYIVLPVPPSVEVAPLQMNNSSTGNASLSANNSSTRPPTDVTVWGFAVVDQYHPTLQRLPVPPSVVAKSRGLQSYNNDVQSSSTKPCSSTICLKFSSKNAPLSDSCPLGEGCTAFHVDRSYLEAARKISEPLCCALHNDYFSQEMLASNCAPQITHQRYTLILDDRAEVELAPSQLALTVGLDQLSYRGYNATSTRIINMRKQICRLHYEGKCKWTKDCGHVHLCRELHRFLLSFHFPSLMFLLMTETSVEKIVAKINQEPQLGEFIRSKCVIPLITQLIEASKSSALEALVSCSAVFTMDQLEALRGFGINVERASIATLNDKIAPFLKPKCTLHASPPKADEALVAVQVAEAAISTPTHTGNKSLTMPTFSPSGSVTSMAERNEFSPLKKEAS